MMFSSFVGLTAIEVSLLGPFFSQPVSTFGVFCVGVVQITCPGLTGVPLPKTAPATGAGASKTLCVISTGRCRPSSSSCPMTVTRPVPTASAPTIATNRCRTTPDNCCDILDLIDVPRVFLEETERMVSRRCRTPQTEPSGIRGRNDGSGRSTPNTQLPTPTRWELEVGSWELQPQFVPDDFSMRWNAA
jgi:hypothetical protein